MIKRQCDLCKQVDDHPHLVYLSDDGSVISAHHDCHADNGVEEAAFIVQAAGGKQGDELRTFLQSGMI